MKDENQPVQINVQIPFRVREDFKIAARMRGLSMSSVIHQNIIRTIREEKDRYPEMFPDYTPDPLPVIVNDESEMDRLIRDVAYEASDGKPLDDETLKMIVRMVKAATEVKEIVNSEKE